ncbi:MAG: DNA starvation/stationary phase protection protein Dps [Verrucomicrobiae bacterium]|nr:DNA starvation/stationary phase protection protein Dps [Verrucomicrobiae bacterium]
MSKSKLNPTNNSLPPKARAEVIALLNTALADLSDLYSQAKQAHWNVRGKRFFMLHELFDKTAETVGAHIDEVAERVTQLGGYAQGTVRMAASASRLKEWPDDLLNQDEFLATLAKRVAAVANSIRAAIDVAAKAGDADTADLFTEISRDLDKALWMLEASE